MQALQEVQVLPDHVSVTQIRMYLRCPAQYYFRYVLGLKIPPPGAAVLGRAVHKGLEHYFRAKLDRPEGAPLREVLEVFAAAFEAEAPEADWADDSPARAKDDGAALLRLHREEVAPHLAPAAVERRVEIPLAGATLLGFVDLETADGLIVDHKTVSRTPPESKAQEDLQLSAYALAYRAAHGRL
ncbi:MAG: RecB family exonuclease, partial [Moorellales bacterium]